MAAAAVPAIVVWMPLIRESWYGNWYSPVLIYHKVATVSAAQGAIQTYNQHSQRTASDPSSGQETLFDEDNWARVMDAREIVYLVHPLIAALHEPQIAAIIQDEATAASNPGQSFEPEQNGAQESSDLPPVQTTPKEVTDLLGHIHTISRSIQRLTEYLVICDGGPAGSSPTRWRLHVTAVVEAALVVLDTYQHITKILREAVPGTSMGNISVALNIRDDEILRAAQHSYLPVLLGSYQNLSYQLQLTSERKCLDIGPKVSQKTTQHKVVNGAVDIMAMPGAPLWPLGMYLKYMRATPEKLETRLTIGSISEDDAKLAFQSALMEDNVKNRTELNKELYRAASGGHLEDVVKLLEMGADPSYQTEYDWTPLHWSAANGYIKVVRVLVHSGAYVNPASDTNLTPLDMSISGKHPEISSFLGLHGAWSQLHSQSSGKWWRLFTSSTGSYSTQPNENGISAHTCTCLDKDMASEPIRTRHSMLILNRNLTSRSCCLSTAFVIICASSSQQAEATLLLPPRRAKLKYSRSCILTTNFDA